MNWKKLLISIAICEGAGIIGSVFTTPAITNWYANLNKPSFNPPNWLFAPVWTTLFFLMGISLYLIWEKLAKNKKAKTAIDIFALQLTLNILWSILFFGLKSPLLALTEIAILWLAILWTMISFYRVSKFAGALLIPYLLWASFAAFLNYTIFRLNV